MQGIETLSMMNPPALASRPEDAGHLTQRQRDLLGLRPLGPNLFVFDEFGLPVALRSCDCKICGRRFFPSRRSCMHCFTADALVESSLSGEGIVHVSTVSRVRSVVGHEPPYAYGYVSLDDDSLRIFTAFAGDTPESFQPGRRVRLSFNRIPATELAPTLGYCFVPAVGGQHGSR
jgi:uncharacterized OB-fold protein